MWDGDLEESGGLAEAGGAKGAVWPTHVVGGVSVAGSDVGVGPQLLPGEAVALALKCPLGPRNIAWRRQLLF